MAKNDRDPGPSVKKPDTYESLRDKGASKEKAARIANAQANKSQNPSHKGGKSPAYEEWSKEDLYRRAKEIGVSGRSDMTKRALMDALRNH